jgi:glycosyltransferase involved in cell wall biosynthesis
MFKSDDEMKVAILVESWGEPWNEGYKNLAKYIVEAISNFIDVKVFPADRIKISLLKDFDLIHVFNYDIPYHLLPYFIAIRRPIIKHIAKYEIKNNAVSSIILDFLKTKYVYDAFIVTMEILKRELGEVVRNKPLFFLPPPVPIDYCGDIDKSNARELLGLQHNCIYIGYAGAINKYKRLDMLFNAIRRVKAEFENKISLIISPSHIYPPKYYTKIRRTLVENKGLYKFLRVNNMRLFYKAIDVLIYPSEYLGSIAPPLVLLEAMSCGTLVIAKRNIITSTIIENGLNGFLFANTEELIEIIKSILRGTIDVESISLRERRYINMNYNPSIVYKKYIEVYKQVLTLFHEQGESNVE